MPQLLRDALRTVEEREGTYGSPADHWGKCADIANALYETDLFSADRWGILWIIDKLVRDGHEPSRDSLLDIAGYADGIDRVRGEPCEVDTVTEAFRYFGRKGCPDHPDARVYVDEAGYWCGNENCRRPL